MIVAAHIGEWGRTRAAEGPRVIARREEGGIGLERAAEGVFAWPDEEIPWLSAEHRPNEVSARGECRVLFTI